MLLKEESGNKLWGSVPSALIDQVEAGVKVSLTATVEKSRDDDHFGFFKRPSKAKEVA